MKVLVTGGAGFIGSAIVRRLIKRGDEVVVLDDLSTGFERSVPGGARLIKGDIRDIQTCQQATAGCQVVFHQAALSAVPRSIIDPSLVHSVNATGTLNVLIAAREAACDRVVYASSSSVYGHGNGAKKESQAPAPISPYAVSKLAGEQYCAAFSASMGLPTVSLRYFNVFGPGQDPSSEYAAVFPRFISSLLEGRAPQIYGDGEQTRDFTFVGDVAEANLLASSAKGVEGQAFNVGAGSPKSVNTLVATLEAILATGIKPTHVPERAGDIRDSLADLTKSRGLLGYAPAADWEASVRETVDWFKNL